MSIQAVAWALDQHIDDAAAKLVLIAIANRVNTKSGDCYPTIGTVCEDASQSRSTVQRKLSMLVSLGLMTKLPTSDQSGRQMANRYRLNFEVRLCRDVEGEGVSVMPHPDTEGVTVDTLGGVTADTPIEPEKEPKVSPIAPKGAEGEGISKGWEQDPAYLAFLTEYGPSQAWPKHRGYRQWLKLTEDERKAAVAAIPAYRAICAKERRKMTDPSAYLRGTFKNFEARLTQRPPESDAVQALRRALGANFSGGVMVEHGTPQWAAWQAVADEAQLPLRAIGYPARPFAGRPKAVTGRYMPSEWPPSRDGPDRQQQAAGG